MLGSFSICFFLFGSPGGGVQSLLPDRQTATELYHGTSKFNLDLDFSFIKLNNLLISGLILRDQAHLQILSTQNRAQATA